MPQLREQGGSWRDRNETGKTEAGHQAQYIEDRIDDDTIAYERCIVHYERHSFLTVIVSPIFNCDALLALECEAGKS